MRVQEGKDLVLLKRQVTENSILLQSMWVTQIGLFSGGGGGHKGGSDMEGLVSGRGRGACCETPKDMLGKKKERKHCVAGTQLDIVAS